jgi:demethylmenaquinone methyltransferase/2-methoxy-6-polyprenyl-1,4-benzoquinol methylase
MGSGAMFDRIARRYDRLNFINSLGLDRGWRRRAIASLRLESGHRLLDLATGTGDLLIEAGHRGVELSGLDPSKEMLGLAREKLARAGVEARLVEGIAEDLPFGASSFDRVSMAFGIRNVPDRARALAEMGRVLAPGGRVAILELAEPEGGLLSAAARLHVEHVVPLVGRLLSCGEAYRYLRSSIAAFPRAAEFDALLSAAGFVTDPPLRLGLGACVLFGGTKA